MRLSVRKYFSIFLFLPFFIQAQDSLFKYRVTSLHISANDFILLAPQYPQINAFFPAGAVSLKSANTDSLYAPLDKFNFMITAGAAASRFLFSDEDFFRNVLDKSPMLVFSKRFWGGFGINYRRRISEKFVFDMDVAPCVQVIVDKSIETRTDTSFSISKRFEDIYEGLHLYTNLKLECKTKSNYAFFFTVSGSVPVINRFVDNGDTRYYNMFKGQLFVGIGLTHFYRSKRKVEAGNK
jgi:hypothetical protein